MIAVFTTVFAALAVIALAPVALRSEKWAVRHPDRAIRCWIALIALGAALLATGAVIALVCTIRSSMQAPDPGAWVEQTILTIAAWGSLAIAGGLLALVWERSEQLADADRSTRRRLHEVAATAAYGRELVGDIEVVYVDVSAPLAMAESFGGRRILVTRGLRDALTAAELRAVLEHERCHLLRRHHLVLRIAAINLACFPSLRAARAFERSVHLLIEMSADDHAARTCGTAVTADALDILAELRGMASAALRAERLRRGISAATRQGPHEWARTAPTTAAYQPRRECGRP